MVIQLEENGRISMMRKGKMDVDKLTITPDHITKMIDLRRHDWLNHIQVLNGLLRLESYNEVRNYLDRITTELQNEHYISQLSNPELVIYIHTYSSRYNSPQLDVEVTELIHLDQYQLSTEQIQALLHSIEVIAKHSVIKNDVLPSLQLTVGKLDKRVKFTIDYEGFVQAPFAELWHEAVQQLRQLDCIVHTQEQNNQEWLIEIIMG